MTVRIDLLRRFDESMRVDVRRFRLDECVGKSEAEISHLKVSVHGEQIPLGELFSVRVSNLLSQAPQCYWSGDCSTVDYLAFEHRWGRIWVEGSIGNHCGACMWSGSLEVTGSSGDSVGAAVDSRGVGMRGGRIWIRGSAGDDVGLRMRRGEILIGGDVGRGLGSLMVAGTICCAGKAGERMGYAMRRGTIVLDLPMETIPKGFSQPRSLQTPFQSIMMQHHARIGFRDDAHQAQNDWQVVRGHAASNGQGELWFRNHSLKQPE